MAVGPFTLSTHGRAEIPHPAERAVIHVSVATQGTNKAAVSDAVVTTAQHIERLLRDLSPADSTPEAKASAALAHWSKTGLSATSHVPYSRPTKDGTPPQPQPRRYDARVTFDIRFRQFKELGAFGTRIAALEHVELSHIEWILTDATYKAHQSALRRRAARDALDKARDYCDVLGCGAPRPVELQEGNVTINAPANRGGMFGGSNHHASGGGGLFGNASGAGGLFGAARPANVSTQSMQTAPGANAGQSDSRDESPLEFTPKEVKMAMEVTIQFCADPAVTSSSASHQPVTGDDGVKASVGPTLAKRARTEMEE